MGARLLRREGYPKGWYTVLVTALGSWEKTVPRGHAENTPCVQPMGARSLSMFIIIIIMTCRHLSCQWEPGC
jgi:hypothetical protein